MVARPEVLAIIPARGGSKGIPRKNICDFAGYPLIAYSIAAGLQAETVTRVVVSTDDEEIADVAREYGANVPFMRPAEHAQDSTLDLPVFAHVLRTLAEIEDYHPDVVIQLRPTSPIRPLTMVDDAVRLLLDNPEADSVRGVVPAGQNPHKMWRIDEASGTMNALLQVEGIDEPYNSPRQKLPPVYWQTGHIDVIRPRAILEKDSMSGDVVLPLLIDPSFTVDIDNPADWTRYEWQVERGGLEMVWPDQKGRTFPKDVKLVIFDFDGVMTDNKVYVDQNGFEMVVANRGDGAGIKMLRRAGIETMVLSTEVNPVVEARCRKLNTPALQGIDDKGSALKAYFADHDVDPAKVIYVGNDLNDMPCFPLVGLGVAVADAVSEVRTAADMVLSRNGGDGAVRELCELILKNRAERS
jgi:YrbI family 3-deoxy-D-manno-octulosonate 8-phosphate phosphatase